MMSAAVRLVNGSGESGGASARTITIFFAPGRQVRSNAAEIPEYIVSGKSPPQPRPSAGSAPPIVADSEVKSWSSFAG